MTNSLSRYLHRGLVVSFLTTFIGVPASAKETGDSFHSFYFNGWNDKRATTVDLLEYDYGGQYSMVRRKAEGINATLGYQVGVHGPMPIGDYLYIQWRIKDTGEVVEREVDLRGLLPTTCSSISSLLSLKTHSSSCFS
jgi:hypothetical protein